MKTFLKTVFGFIFGSMFIFSATIFILLCYCYIFEDLKFKNWPFLFFCGGMTLLSFYFCYKLKLTEEIEPEEKPKEKTKTENLKTDNPENDEIITVTEIKGVKKIIKNGKVIYCEQLKADELKVFEQLNEKNPTVTSGIKTYSKE